MTYAPQGFTAQSWQQFITDGIYVLPDVLSPRDVSAYLSLIDKYASQTPDGWEEINIVERFEGFQTLIDHPAHIGFVHDLYGDSLKLLLSQFFVRPTNTNKRNAWHYDGPRQTPFQVFSPRLPLRVKVGYWLTDVSQPNSGNLIFLRGSHRKNAISQYQTHDYVKGQEQLCVAPGSIVLMHEGLWHRVAPNEASSPRKNLFLEYGPSWIQASDRYFSDPNWILKLTREQQIIMRSYEHPNQHIKPPGDHASLYELRQSESDMVSPVYDSSIPCVLQKKATWVERMGFA